AAALVVDGELIAAAEEERFVGVKFANGRLPRHAAEFCLRQAGLEIHDIDAVVFAGATYENFDTILHRFLEYQFGHAPPVVLVDHHAAHAASTYFGSGWDESLVVTIDRSGDRKSTTVSTARNGQIQLVESTGRENSLGLFYSAVTQFLGFESDRDEYKVMGMSAYGRPVHDFSHVLEITSSGYQFHCDFIRGILDGVPGPSKQERLFDAFPLNLHPRVPGTPFQDDHFNVAASAQYQLEQAVLQVIKHHVDSTGIRRVCLAGGVALNCLLNQKIREADFVDEIYAPPVCSDAGLALGAAYLHGANNGDQPRPLGHAYWGPEFSDTEIRDVLVRSKLNYQETADPVAAAVERIAAGKILGWFQGRMEYGPRALGNRSILASPQNANMKERINSRVKFREEFRPFAPSMLSSDTSEYFENATFSPFMTQTFTAKNKLREQAPATVHEDATSRPQSVLAGTNPLFASLISSLGKATGVPVVLNTSLNAYSDPIACEPYQALRTFFATGLDSMVMGNFVLDKPF
ncbi:MAG: carbamoyltransferase C-terminal domain-containing protein, partial [Pirellulaceae bacterium]